MLYTTILLALTVTQISAQDAFDTDATSDYTSAAVDGDTTYISETPIAYVSASDETETTSTSVNTSTSITTSSQTDSSATVNTDSAISLTMTSEYTFETTQGGTTYSESTSSSSSTYSSSASATPLISKTWFQIRFERDQSKCLAIFDTSYQDNTAVIGHEAHWQVDVNGVTQIKSRVYDPEEWCLDAGQNREHTDWQGVVINKCQLGVYNQLWQYSDNHLVVYDTVRNLDLQDGDSTGGGYLQNWNYTYGNDHQTWILAPAPNT